LTCSAIVRSSAPRKCNVQYLESARADNVFADSMWLRTQFIFLPALLIFSCGKKDLRGESTPSADGHTYLLIAESPGCAAFSVDGKPWPHGVGVRGAVSAGRRELSCSDGSNQIQFEVKQGQTFRFDYWGP
jgi:hypothetical protein